MTFPVINPIPIIKPVPITKLISSFRGKYAWLSNFYDSIIDYEAINYKSVEHAYQAAKTLSEPNRVQISRFEKPGDAKRFARSVTLRSDWEAVKVSIMRDLVRKKFFLHPDLARKLVETKGFYLEEGNAWNDTFWGVCKGVGLNHLGIILIQVRGELIKLGVE